MSEPGGLRHAVVTAIGGGIGIAIMVALGAAAEMPLSVLPFTTSIVLVMAAPDSPPARPRSIVGGHVLSAIAGFAVLWLLGSGAWLAAIAVGLAILVMQLTDTLHPPAAINALLVTTLGPTWTYFFVPTLAGALILVAYATLYHRATHDPTWPPRWW